MTKISKKYLELEPNPRATHLKVEVYYDKVVQIILQVVWNLEVSNYLYRQLVEQKILKVIQLLVVLKSI